MFAGIAIVRYPLLAELTAPVQWAVLGVAVLGTAILLFKPKFLKRDPLSRSPQSTSLSQQRSVERQMQTLLVELSEMSRQVTASLDTRATKLDLLIREADQKIAILTSLQANGAPSGGPDFRMNDLPERSMAIAKENGPSEQLLRLSDSTLDNLTRDNSTRDNSTRGNSTFGDPTSRDRSLNEVAQSMSSLSTASPYDDDARHAEVYLLADQGQTSAEIAAQLRRPNGEIQLILALRPDSKARS